MATPDGTASYFKRLAHKKIPEDSIRTLGKTSLTVGCIGFGGYRVHHNSVEHAKALRYAMLNGFNLIDTSSNYGDGGSEMLIGNLLHEMFERNELERDEVTVVSKVGYVQGQNLRIARQFENENHPFPEMVKHMEGCWHCIHPDFLEDQLSRSLERLCLPSIDVYLLHNPEYFLSDRQKKNGVDVVAAREAYYLRIRKAFEWLEEKVAEGKIKAYGVSSNTFIRASSDFEFTSLTSLLDMAESVATDNYFQVVQFPFNLFETGASQELNHSDGKECLLDIARSRQIGTLVNRPLNATYQGALVRLASFRVTDAAEIVALFHRKLTTVQRLESQFQNEFLNKLPTDLSADNFEKAFQISGQLENALSAFQGWEHWDHVKQIYLMPHVVANLNHLHHRMQETEGWTNWADSYVDAVVSLLDAITRKYENEAAQRSLQLSGKLKSIEAQLETAPTLSQQALRVVTSVAGVDCVLLGMRKTPYVEDAIEVLRAPQLHDAADTIRRFGASD